MAVLAEGTGVRRHLERIDARWFMIEHPLGAKHKPAKAQCARGGGGLVDVNDQVEGACSLPGKRSRSHTGKGSESV